MQSADGRWKFWHWKIVSKTTYITRLVLFRTPWCGAKLHWMHGPDPERDPHDHPGAFVSIILRGGYTEKRLEWFWASGTPCFATLKHRWFNWMPAATQAHRIVAVEPRTLTLVLHGPWRRQWGFHTRDGWVPWREYKDA